MSTTRAKLALDPNKPKTVALKYMDWFVHETYGESLKLVVVEEGVEKSQFVKTDQQEPLMAVVDVTGQTEAGHPKFFVKAGAWVTIEREAWTDESDGKLKSKFVVKAAGLKGGQGTGAASRSGGTSNAPESRAPASQPAQGQAAPWRLAEIANQVTDAARVSAAALREALGPKVELNQDALVKLTATVMIRMEHVGYRPAGPEAKAPAPAAKPAQAAKPAAKSGGPGQPTGSLDDFPEALDDGDDDLPF